MKSYITKRILTDTVGLRSILQIGPLGHYSAMGVENTDENFILTNCLEKWKFDGFLFQGIETWKQY